MAENRGQMLDREVDRYIKQGYRVISRGDTTAQLVKPKSFNLILSIILLLLGGFPFVIYLLWYLAAKDKTVYLSVDERGRVSAR